MSIVNRWTARIFVAPCDEFCYYGDLYGKDTTRWVPADQCCKAKISDRGHEARSYRATGGFEVNVLTDNRCKCSFYQFGPAKIAIQEVRKWTSSNVITRRLDKNWVTVPGWWFLSTGFFALVSSLGIFPREEWGGLLKLVFGSSCVLWKSYKCGMKYVHSIDWNAFGGRSRKRNKHWNRSRNRAMTYTITKKRGNPVYTAIKTTIVLPTVDLLRVHRKFKSRSVVKNSWATTRNGTAVITTEPDRHRIRSMRDGK